MIRRTFIALLLLTIAAPASGGEPRVLDRSLKPVASAFNDSADRTRFLAILSPT